MHLRDFRIGEMFETGSGAWVCLDKGKYFVLAIKIEFIKDYVEGEECANIVLFDKWDFGGCKPYDE